MSNPAVCVLAFDSSNRLAVASGDDSTGLPFLAASAEAAEAALAGVFPEHTPPVEYFLSGSCAVYFSQVAGAPGPGIEFRSIESLEAETLAPDSRTS